RPILPIHRALPAATAQASAAFFNAGCPAATTAQVIQLGPADLAAGDHFQLVDYGRMDGESTLHPYAGSDAAHGEGLRQAAALPGDDRTLEHLDPLPVAFPYLDVDPDGVAGLEVGDVISQLFLFKAAQPRHHGSLLSACMGETHRQLYHTRRRASTFYRVFSSFSPAPAPSAPAWARKSKSSGVSWAAASRSGRRSRVRSRACWRRQRRMAP